MSKLNLCKNCIEDLKEYNPYVDKNGNTIPITQLDIKEVSKQCCDNFKINARKTDTIHECDCCGKDLRIDRKLVFDNKSIGIYCSMKCYKKANMLDINDIEYDEDYLRLLRSR